ncbi:MAG: transporter [Methylococcales bacterium]|nr:transporter [Methylococcales bacterium]
MREADAEADIHSVESLWSLSVSAAYGITDDLTIGVRLPFIMRNNIKEPEHDHVGSGAEIESLGDVEGIGDTTFYSQYRFFKNGGTNASVLLGIKTPTGKTNRGSPHGILDAEFQPGTGSWDGILGLAFTQELAAFSIDASTVYTVASEGTQDTDLGDIFSYNFALSYRLFGQQGLSYEAPKYAFDAILEYNGEWRDKEEVGSIKDNNSGGNIGYISPGLRFSAGKNVSIAASFGIPVVQSTNGDQVEPDYRVISSINFSF